ncbi:hypothetical protein B0H13DRAFT_2029768, partial [Mycena leptocephala]
MGGALVVLHLRVDYAAVRATSAMVVRVRGRGTPRERALTEVIEGATAEIASASAYQEALDAWKEGLFAGLATMA